jgi:hypothetical protein
MFYYNTTFFGVYNMSEYRTLITDYLFVQHIVLTSLQFEKVSVANNCLCMFTIREELITVLIHFI